MAGILSMVLSWFGSARANAAERADTTASIPPAPREQASELLARGETMQAERLMLAYADDLKRRLGPNHPAYAKALFLLSSVRLNIQDFDGGIEALREAAAIPGADHQTRRDQITYGWNLGMVLSRANRLEEAEQVLRSNLENRLAFYGREHAGYAFGLVNLAVVQWQLHRPADAVVLAEEAYSNLRGNNQKEQWEAAVLLGCVRGDLPVNDPEPFRNLREAEPGDMGIAVSKLREWTEYRPAVEMLPRLLALRDYLLAAGERYLEQAEYVQYLIVQAAKAAKRHEVRIDALLWLIARHPEASDDSVDLRVGLANARQDLGDTPGELLAFDQACAVAQHVPGKVYSDTLRNSGLAYRDAGQLEKGIALMRQALALARERQLPEQIGRACIALGVTLQHAKRIDEPLVLLKEGVEKLPLFDSIMIAGYSHIRAIEMGLTDCCEASGDYAICRALMEYTNRTVSEGLVTKVTKNGQEYVYKTSRDPTPEERQLLSRIIAHARAASR